MNRSEFINLIGNPSLLNRQATGEINELLSIFPYFQSAHLLLLKGLHNTADIKFENQLRNSAIHIADREVLYYLLNAPPKIAEAEPAVVQNASQIDTSARIQEVASSIVVPAIPENENIPIRDPEADCSDEYPEEPAVPGTNLATAAPEIEDLAEMEKKNPGGNPSVSDHDDNDDLLELEQDTNETNTTATAAEPQNQVRQTPDWRIQSDLIDKFIIANPRIEPIRDKTPLTPEEINKHDQDEGIFVTETLAKIYVKQGYYSKAIDIYERLSLKFPEKSSYFAIQIEKVKEYLKN